MEAINWTMAHWLELVAALGSIVTAASLIAKFTPTPKDDQFFAKVRKVLDFLAVNPKQPKK